MATFIIGLILISLLLVAHTANLIIKKSTK